MYDFYFHQHRPTSQTVFLMFFFVLFCEHVVSRAWTLHVCSKNDDHCRAMNHRTLLRECWVEKKKAKSVESWTETLNLSQREIWTWNWLQSCSSGQPRAHARPLKSLLLRCYRELRTSAAKKQKKNVKAAIFFISPSGIFRNESFFFAVSIISRFSWCLEAFFFGASSRNKAAQVSVFYNLITDLIVKTYKINNFSN